MRKATLSPEGSVFLTVLCAAGFIVMASSEICRLTDGIILERCSVVIGLRSAETLYRATAELPVSLLTADVIRGRLDRI